MADNYDVVIIGAGPGGYVAAIRCAQLGMKTAVVDRWLTPDGKPALGGTCLNVGCIPSKALLESSERYESMRDHAGAHGISADNVRIDIEKMIERKEKIVAELTGGIAQLFKANQIDWIAGNGQLLADHIVSVQTHEGEKRILHGEHIIIATGSVPATLDTLPIDNEYVFDSSGTLSWTTVPKRLVVVGAGVIGLELGSVWRRLGAEVVLLEAMDRFLPAADTQVARLAKRELVKQGLDIRLGARLKASKIDGGEIALTYTDSSGEHTISADRVISAIGRRPLSAEVLADDAGITLDQLGFIEVDQYCATSQPRVWAVGDVVRGPMLAHKASEEGVAVAERIAGQKPEINYHAIPFVIYTYPEIAWVGDNEQQLKERGITYRSGSFSFAANGRAKAMQATTGQIKVLADASTDRLLGAHIIGPTASELIGQAVVAMESENTSEDLARTVFAHPTLSEVLHEAALAVDGRAIHGINRK